MNALAERIVTQRSATAGRPALGDPKSTLTNRELIAAARDIAGLIWRTSASRSPMVVVALPLSSDAIVTLLGAIVGDYSVCFIDPAAPDRRRESIISEIGPDVVVDADGIHRSPVVRESPPRNASPGYVAMSSGSTGGPKGVLTPWSTVEAFIPHCAEALDLDCDSSWAEISHPAYDMAMTNLLLALSAGGTVSVTASLADRVRPLRYLDRVGATHVRLAPRFIDLAAAEGRTQRDGRLRIWGSGGDRLFAVQAERVFELGIPIIVNTYGTSETAGFASAARLTSDAPLDAVHGSVTIGRGVVGAWSVHLDHDHAEGMLSIRTPHRPDGYLFGQIPADFPRWQGADVVVTGDVGGEAAGQLFCLGRAGRRVKRNASFVDLDEVDATVRSTCGVVSFTVATASGRLVSLVEIKAGDADHLRQSLPSVLRPEVLPDRLMPVAQLPRLGNGKVDHVAAQELADGA